MRRQNGHPSLELTAASVADREPRRSCRTSFATCAPPHDSMRRNHQHAADLAPKGLGGIHRRTELFRTPYSSGRTRQTRLSAWSCHGLIHQEARVAPQRMPIIETTERGKRRDRRSHTAEFKPEIVDRCRAGDRSIREMARDLDLTESAVRKRVAQAEIDAGQRAGLTSGERVELSRLRRENKRLQADPDGPALLALGPRVERTRPRSHRPPERARCPPRRTKP